MFMIMTFFWEAITFMILPALRSTILTAPGSSWRYFPGARNSAWIVCLGWPWISTSISNLADLASTMAVASLLNAWAIVCPPGTNVQTAAMARQVAVTAINRGMGRCMI